MANEMKSNPFCVDFSCLPKDCIAHVLSFTSPLDACKLSLLCRAIKSVADSDDVWEKFFPTDYQSILSQSSAPSLLDSSSKKELFFHLCKHPVLIDNGCYSFSLDKRNGKKCYMLAARILTIIESRTPDAVYWISLPNSRFPEVVSIDIVYSLGIYGEIKIAMLSPKTKYAAYLVFKLSRTSNHHYYGFRASPIEASVYISKLENLTSIHIPKVENHVRRVCLDPYLDQEEEEVLWGDHAEYDVEELMRLPRPKEREDGWFEIELGEYSNGRGKNTKLKMVLREVRCSIAKRGLIVQGIEVRPKEDA